MKVKVLTPLFLVLLCATTASAQGPLLSKSVTGVNASTSVTENVTLDRAFLLKGAITSNDPASLADSVVARSTTSSASFFGSVNQITGTYRIVLPADTYNLEAGFTHTVGQLSASFTFAAASGITVSSDTIVNFAVPAVTTTTFTGTVSNLNASFTNNDLAFDSTTISGFLNVSASAATDATGNFSVLLTSSGTYNVTLFQSMISFTTLASSDLTTTLGPVAVANPITLTASSPSLVSLGGTLTLSGSPIPANSTISADDVTGGAAPQTVSSGNGPVSSTGAFGSFTLIQGRTFALNPVFQIQVIPTPAPLADYTPPDPSPQALTTNTIRNVNYPAPPASATAVSIMGRVTITGSLSPVAHANVFVTGSNITGAPNTSFSSFATADAFGNYSLTVPAGTQYELFVSGAFNTLGDFDADGKADFDVFRPFNGTHYVDDSDPSLVAQQWGESGDIPVLGDFDGDGKTDFAVWRPSSGTWYVIPSSNPNNFIVQQWGVSGDIPVPGDYDGDGISDFAVWRPSTGQWFIIPSSNPNNFIVQQWGVSGDIPVPGDYDGDGKTDLAVWRPSNGVWYVIPSSSPNNFIVQQWGLNGDAPVPGDYDADGKTDFAVWRASSGTWYVIPSATPNDFLVQQWGANGDIPVPADYDRDRKTDFAVWRPTNGTWYVIPSATPNNFLVTQWGLAGDIPVLRPNGQ
jgi:hypothetical protein